MSSKELDAAIKDAIANPREANIGELCIMLDAVLVDLPHHQQLEQGGRYIAQIAEVFWMRVDALACERPDVVEDAIDLSNFFRQSLSLPIENFSHSIPRYRAQKASPNKPLKPLPQKTIEEWIESAEVKRQTIFSLSHHEDIEGWARRVSTVLQRPMSFHELQIALKDAPWIEIWMGILLGGFEVEIEPEEADSESFYRANFVVHPK